MRMIMVLHFAWLVTVLGCTSTRDIAHYPFPEAQGELRKVLDGGKAGQESFLDQTDEYDGKGG